ncbi:MAG: 1-acyl-sn-glycerol-3-phosphate acyltransferase [Firmicutes bacterium]|nr:1-acyl-sn-glycerol-3-phosphate acyltransferase [Bacillota bacterium]MCM1400550.1 1-acyl-sn-glycerol-3-phosphate acyltransferase [Bacteroides sp.]MCM1476454.1 1-acyl-sn-glycerol-3-phosphate acyltransferase [Bacteroides sp.]
MAENKCEVRPDVLNYDDISRMIPKLAGHKKLVNRLLHFLSVDKVNAVHGRCCDTPGPEFVRRLLFEEFKIKLRIDNEQELDHLPQGAFITVSNHPLGALDGIALIYLISSRRPKFKVMVNMILNQISAMRPNFIAVDAWASNNPKNRQVSVNGIFQALRQLKNGEPVGFFPAGAMSKTNWKWQLEDRPWQKSVLQIIQRAKVPVIPIYFHDRNSLWCDILGHVFWQGRSLRLPAEVFRKKGKTLHISIGEPISVEQQEAHGGSPEQLGAFLREKTYQLRDRYK